MAAENFEEYLDSCIGPIIEAETDDWRHIASAAKITPEELESAILLLPDEVQEGFTSILVSYKNEALNAFNDLSESLPSDIKKPPINDWYDFVWKRPVFIDHDLVNVIVAFFCTVGMDHLTNNIRELYKERYIRVPHYVKDMAPLLDYCRESILEHYSMSQNLN